MTPEAASGRHTLEELIKELSPDQIDALSLALDEARPGPAASLGPGPASLVGASASAASFLMEARAFFAQSPANNSAVRRNASADVRNTDNLLGIDMSQLKVAQLEGLLWAMAICAVCAVVAFELLHYQCADVDLQRPVVFGKEAKEERLLHIFDGIWPLVSPYLFQKGTNKQWFYIATLAILGVWDMVLSLIFTVWSKDFWDVIEKQKGDEFLGVMIHFTLLVATLIMVGAYQQYIGMMLTINWRKWMTAWLLEAWLSNKTFYQLQLANGCASLDNPDQRLQEDIHMFIPTFIHLVGGLTESMGRLLSYLPLLIVLSPTYAFGLVYFPGWLFYIAMLYSGVGTFVAHLIGQKLILISFARQKYEADFRYHVVQVRDKAESIALYGSEEVERKRMMTRFEGIVRVWWLLMQYSKRLSLFTAFYMQTSITFPYLVLAPNYFKGQITLGTMFMLFRALGNVKSAFDWIIGSYTTLTDFRATADRLLNFRDAVEGRESPSKIVHLLPEAAKVPGSVLVAKDICVQLPDAAGCRAVWRGADLAARQGEFVLLTAPEGSGKSCFFRALAGIWPNASGTVYMPQSTLFVPQKSHIPQGTLKQALTYPESEDRFSNEDVLKALAAVGLEKTVKGRELSEEANWEMVLSGGEQQRLAIAHAVLRRPGLLFLDEATSAMGEEGALELYALLRRPGTLPEGAAVVSISHDVALLRPVHDSCYRYDSEQAGWVKEECAAQMTDAGLSAKPPAAAECQAP